MSKIHQWGFELTGRGRRPRFRRTKAGARGFAGVPPELLPGVPPGELVEFPPDPDPDVPPGRWLPPFGFCGGASPSGSVRYVVPFAT